MPREPGPRCEALINISRRVAARRVGNWLIYVGAVAVGACGRTPLGFLGGDDSSTVTPTPSPTPTASPTATPDCGTCDVPSGFDTGLVVTDVPPGTVAYDAGHHIFLCCDNNGIYAMTSLCSHSGCDIGMSGSGGGVFNPSDLGAGFHCNCHGSNYFPDGSVENGPAGAPLTHYRTAIDTNQHIWIDQTPPFLDVTCRCPV